MQQSLRENHATLRPCSYRIRWIWCPKCTITKIQECCKFPFTAHTFSYHGLYTWKSVGTIPLLTQTFRPSHRHSFQISNAESPRRYVYRNHVQRKLYTKNMHITQTSLLHSSRKGDSKLRSLKVPRINAENVFSNILHPGHLLQEAFCTEFCKVTKLIDSHKEIKQLFPVAISWSQIHKTKGMEVTSSDTT